MMRTRTEQLEVLNSFPQTGELMRRWENDYGKDDEFKPKVINLFQSIASDIQNLFEDFRWIYSLSYKIGVIGNGSVGKSALIMKLAELTEFMSMIAVERSTFGYLQFDTLIYKDLRNNKNIPITFIDIEGATDNDESESIGNYIQLINKADCDMYILVFDGFFSDHNDICRKHIESKLKWKCLLVRSKADMLFNQFFRQIIHENYNIARSKEYDAMFVLNQIKGHALKTSDDRHLTSTVYLTAAVCDENLNGTPFAQFDLNELKKKLVQFAVTDLREQRICNLATRTAIIVINTCFRRAYTVTQTKYKWLAAGASLVPFLNEIPAFLDVRKFVKRLVFMTLFAVTNAVRKTTDSFEQYLVKKKLTILKEYLTSGEFKYLRVDTGKETTTSLAPRLEMYNHQNLFSGNRNQSSNSRRFSTQANNVVKSLVAVVPTACSAVGAFAASALQVVRPATQLTARALSIAGIFVNLALTPVFAAWSFYSAGQGMNRELHSICDDLVVILQYFTVDRCNDCCGNLQRPLPRSSDEDSSSSDED